MDQRAGIDIDIAIRCFGEYSYRVANPLLFYTNVCGNVGKRILTAEPLTPAENRVADRGAARLPQRSAIWAFDTLPFQATPQSWQMLLNQELSAKWRDLRGLEIVSFGVSSVKANEEDEKMIKVAQPQYGLYGPHPRGGASCRRTGRRHAGGDHNPNAGPAMAFHGHGDGRSGAAA